MSVALLSMESQKALGFNQKYLNLGSEDDQRSYRFGKTEFQSGHTSTSGRSRFRVCVCALVFVTNEDMNLYNDTGMTPVLQGEGNFSGHCPFPHFSKRL